MHRKYAQVLAVLVGLAANWRIYAICGKVLQNAYIRHIENVSPERKPCAMSDADRSLRSRGLGHRVSSTRLIVTAGLAEIVAGAIAGGLRSRMSKTR